MFDFRYKYQKAVEGAMKAGSLRANGQLPRVRTDLYSISFEDDRWVMHDILGFHGSFWFFWDFIHALSWLMTKSDVLLGYLIQRQGLEQCWTRVTFFSDHLGIYNDASASFFWGGGYWQCLWAFCFDTIWVCTPCKKLHTRWNHPSIITMLGCFGLK